METFTWSPSWGAEIDVEPRVRSTRFGDGYEQRSPDGIQTIERKFDFIFDKRTEAEIIAINDFLEARRGVEAFLFRLNVLDTKKRAVICRKWNKKAVEHNSYSLSAVFEVDFNAYIVACQPAFIAPLPEMNPESGDHLVFQPSVVEDAGAIIYYTFDPLSVPPDPIPGGPDSFIYTGGDEFGVMYGYWKVMVTLEGKLDSEITQLHYVDPALP